MALQDFCTLRPSIAGVSIVCFIFFLGGGGLIALLGFRMLLDCISACSWLLHDNKSDRSYAYLQDEQHGFPATVTHGKLLNSHLETPNPKS